jgi:hypothetical protein
MVLALSGALDHQPTFELSDNVRLAMTEAGGHEVTPEAWLRLKVVARHWVERADMDRFTYADVRGALDTFTKLAAKGDGLRFLEALRSPSDGDGETAVFIEQQVGIIGVLAIGPDWQSALRSSPRRVIEMRPRLMTLKLALKVEYSKSNGGQRDVDLGWVILELAVIAKEIGISVAEGNVIEKLRSEEWDKDRGRIMVWTEDDKNERGGPFVRFVQAFTDGLPRDTRDLPPNVGNSVRAALKIRNKSRG